MNADAVLQDLRDRATIRDLLMRYGRAVDRRDFAAVTACFAANASYRGSLGTGGIGIALTALRERMARFDTTMHFIGTQVIDLAGDSAHSETYALVYHRLPAGEEGEESKDLVVGVRYLDDLVRHGDGWIIQQRAAVLEWQRFDAVALPPEG